MSSQPFATCSLYGYIASPVSGVRCGEAHSGHAYGSCITHACQIMFNRSYDYYC